LRRVTPTIEFQFLATSVEHDGAATPLFTTGLAVETITTQYAPLQGGQQFIRGAEYRAYDAPNRDAPGEGKKKGRQCVNTAGPNV